ncbi:MAG: T9SS type A sorting domain-containing protein [Bacteroidales bacterium]|nr:T9SS type A sorting domain-containing protein [Bacteroidales bacterium]
MKKLLLIASLAMALMANAQTITIGEGNGMTDVVPYNTFYNYSFTEQIFLASEIEYAGNIKAVSFRLAYSYNTEYTSNIVVYLKNVSRNTFEDTSDYEPVTEEDIVFSGLWTIPADYDGWITIEFDTPFAYNGTDNLLIAVDENSEDYAIRYFRFTDTSNTVLSYCSDIWNLNPYDLGSFVGPKEVSHYRANIKLVFGGNVGIDEGSVNALSVYPNPNHGQVSINLPEEDCEIVVFNCFGQQVYQTESKGMTTLNLEGLNDGVYFVTVKSESAVSTLKFVKE